VTEHIEGAAAAKRSNQRFVRIHRATATVDDRLESHGEFRCDAGLAAHLAALAGAGVWHDFSPVRPT
jgi:hypothetical protein